MNPQIIQPTPDAARPSDPQPIARPIVYAQQPASYQPKDVQPAQATNPVVEQRPPAVITRPAAPITARQRTVIRGSDEDDAKLLTHGKKVFNV